MLLILARCDLPPSFCPYYLFTNNYDIQPYPQAHRYRFWWQQKTKNKISLLFQVMTIAQLQADHYLRIRYVFEFFNFLIGHLVSKEPDDPVQFLVKLINQCLLAREGKAETPLLFDDEHVHSVYRAFDPFARGSISYQQYQEAMRTLGLNNRMTPYDRNPSVADGDFVKESTFKNEV